MCFRVLHKSLLKFVCEFKMLMSSICTLNYWKRPFKSDSCRHSKSPASQAEVAEIVGTAIFGTLTGERLSHLQLLIKETIPLIAWTLLVQDPARAFHQI